MDEEQALEDSLKGYKEQLSSVEAALSSACNDKELQELRDSLLEVIQLTQESLLSLKKKKLLSNLNCDELQQDDEQSEFERFQAEIAAISNRQEDVPNEEEDDNGLSRYLSELEGKLCRAPHIQEWGELAYHNAMIVDIDAQGAESIDDVQVCVMYCNPSCISMKPCTFFLEGHCRFSTDDCRFSHGETVKLSDIQDYTEPNYSLVQRDAVCVAKYSDGLWYKAIVQECLDDNQVTVKYTRYKEEATLAIEDVLPLDNQPTLSESDTSEDEIASDPADDVPEVVWISSTDISMGDWEKYTKGIGSKLMEQMGYVKGQGLGKNGEGMIDPIEATILPQGKSLDKCMELRELRELRKVDLAEKKSKKQQRLEDKKVVDGYQFQLKKEKKKNVFDFLNSKLKVNKELSLGTPQNQDLKKTSVKNLNVQALRVSEDISKTQRELKKLHQALDRNKDRDRGIKSQLEGKIEQQQKALNLLQTQEKAINREQSTRNNHKKLTIF